MYVHIHTGPNRWRWRNREDHYDDLYTGLRYVDTLNLYK